MLRGLSCWFAAKVRRALGGCCFAIIGVGFRSCISRWDTGRRSAAVNSGADVPCVVVTRSRVSVLKMGEIPMFQVIIYSIYFHAVLRTQSKSRPTGTVKLVCEYPAATLWMSICRKASFPGPRTRVMTVREQMPIQLLIERGTPVSPSLLLCLHRIEHRPKMRNHLTIQAWTKAFAASRDTYGSYPWLASIVDVGTRDGVNSARG